MKLVSPARILACLIVAGIAQAAGAQSAPPSSPACIVVSGGTGSEFSDPRIDKTWVEVNRQVTDSLFDQLRQNGYAVREVFDEIADRNAKPQKSLVAVARTGCAQMLQVVHQVNENADGKYFGFDITVLRFVADEGGPPKPGAHAHTVGDFQKSYRHPRTSQELDNFHTGTFAASVYADVVASGVIEGDFDPDPDSWIVHQAYDRVLAAQPKGGIEVHVRHILLPEEAQARTAIARIQHGEQFGVVAKEMTIDMGSRDKGGDLDWARSAAYVPEFARAVDAYAPKGFDPDPVRTQFGWHVVEVLETRPARFPSFDDVKVRLAATLKARHDEAMKAKAH